MGGGKLIVACRHLLLWTLSGLAMIADTRAQTTVTLREGTGVHLSASANGERLSFDLAGLIWTVNPADGTTQALTPPELLARRPALSADGRRIVFDAGEPGRRQLWAVDADGGSPERLTFGSFDNHSPVWHPDGQRLAFVSNRNQSASIWELELATGNLRQRTFSTSDERDPAYSATGDRLAFVQSRSAGDALLVVGERGQPERIIDSADRIRVPSWRPDDSLLTFVHRAPGNSELRVVILSEPPAVRRLTRGENLLATPAVWLDKERFLYMADGRIRQRRFDDFQGVDIAFQAALAVPAGAVPAGVAPLPPAGSNLARGVTGIARAGDRLFVTALGDVWELDATGGVVGKLTTAPFLDTQLSGSPDGTRLAFVSDRGNGLQLWSLELAENTLRELTAEPGGAFYPTWRPDGGAIAYLAEPRPDARNLTLKGVHIESGEVVELARGLPADARPAWLADGKLTVQLGNGNQLVFTSDTAMALRPEPDPAQTLGSPDGKYVASLAAGRLTVLPVAPPAASEPLTLAAGQAARPQWLDGGRALAWVSPGGPMTWSPGDQAARPLPVALTWQPATPAADRRLVIRAGRVFDGLGPGYEYAQDILIVGNRIAAIGPWRDPPAGELLDARDLTVLPGLMDLAVQPRRPVGEQAGRAWLAWGVTSVRELVRDPTATLERRESWASAQRPGPRLFTVVNGCGADAAAWTVEPLGVVGMAVCADQAGPRQQSAIQGATEAGLNAIAPEAFPGALLGAREIPLRAGLGDVAAYPDTANRFIYGDLIEVAGAARLTSVSKLSAIGLPGLLLDEESLLQDARLAAFLRPAELSWYRQSWQAQAESYRTALRAEARLTGQSLFRAVGRGARIVIGSGAPAVPPGLGVHAELRLLRQTGLQPFQVLRMATLDAASAIGADSLLGTVETGALADLILVRGDPLKDIAAAAAIEFTVIDGRVFEAARLQLGAGVGNFYSP